VGDDVQLWAATLEETDGPSLLIHGSDWCHCHSFGVFDNGMTYTALGLLVSVGVHLSQRGKRVFAHKLVGFIDRALN